MKQIEDFVTLNVSPGASQEAIRQAYRDLVNVWHPDRFAHDARLYAKAEEQMMVLREAYDRLTAVEEQPEPEGSAPAGELTGNVALHFSAPSVQSQPFAWDEGHASARRPATLLALAAAVIAVVVGGVFGIRQVLAPPDVPAIKPIPKLTAPMEPSVSAKPASAGPRLSTATPRRATRRTTKASRPLRRKPRPAQPRGPMAISWGGSPSKQ